MEELCGMNILFAAQLQAIAWRRTALAQEAELNALKTALEQTSHPPPEP